MCGIAGKIDFRGPVSEGLLERMCSTIVHRGPDERGMFVNDGVALGMQRLSIIDVAGGHQPVFNEDRSIVAVFNGEIYNFHDLRTSLQRRGHQLASQSDSEVIVHLYEEHGARFVEHLRGMFAIALWDSRSRKLVLARDRAGKKPLFWAKDGSRIWFASEIRSLLEDPSLSRSPNVLSIAQYLTYDYVGGPQSAFDSISRLEPATILELSADGHTARRYWTLDYRTQLDLPEPELVEMVSAALDEATAMRLESEVPLGAFLSGGIDSSAVVAMMARHATGPVKTFSIGFSTDDADHDELSFARLVAHSFSTDHHEFIIEPDASTIMPKIARHYGEPFADPSALPSFYLSEMTRQHVTVALNGDGADESFGGYGRYRQHLRAARADIIPPSLRRSMARMLAAARRADTDRSLLAKLQRRSAALALTPAQRYAEQMSHFPVSGHPQSLQPALLEYLGDTDMYGPIEIPWQQAKVTNLTDRLLAVDVDTYLAGDLLPKIDTATMASSLEARSPFLDHHVMELAASLPARYKIRGNSGKYILKESFRGVLPDEVLDRPKMGFGIPIARWFREDLRKLPEEILMDEGARSAQFIRRDYTERMLQEHREGIVDHSTRFWVMLQLEHWYREVVERP